MQVIRHRRSINPAVLRVAVAAFSLGGLTSSVLVADAAGAASSHKAKSLTIGTTKNATQGTILVVGGRTVYFLKTPSSTACTSQCLKIWPEVLLPKGVKHAKAGKGVKASKLGTEKDGRSLQATYGGHSLYFFVGDTAPGQVNGNISDVWGTWSDVVTTSPAHVTITAPTLAPAAKGTTTTKPPAPGSKTKTTTKPKSTPAIPTTPLPTPTTQPTQPTTPPTHPPTPPTQPPPTTTPTTYPPPPPPTTTPTTSPGGGGGGGVGF
jgi:predicted lipoprotein with Yx(FWY)xxD motif